MHGFPPSPDGQVTLANWRTSPFNRWAFHHVRELLPSADIANDPGTALVFPFAPVDTSTLRIDRDGGQALSLEGFLEETNTDGLVIVHRGRVVFERYAGGTTADSPHILMSVSKSLLGLLAGILADRNALDPDRLVTDVVPEISGTAYEGATVRHLLDMRAGIDFDEDYLATSGPIVAYRRVGQLMVDGGARGSRQIVPESWIDDITRRGDPQAWAAGDLASYFPGLPVRYRSQWYAVDGEPPMLFGLGVHGQHVFIDRTRGIVIAKVSSQALPLDGDRITLTMRGAAAITEFLDRDQ